MTDVFDDLDYQTVSIIGDQVEYSQSGTPAVTIRAWVDHSPDVVDFGITAGVTAEASMQVRKLDIPTIDKSADRITLPRTGKIYRLATAPLHSKCGRLWNLVLVSA